MKRRTLTPVLAAAALLAASFGAAPGPAAATPLPEQWRSYWIDAFNEGIYTPDQAAQLVAEAEQLNTNALIVQTSRRYDCFCNRALYPRTDAAVDPLPYDPLDEIIDQAGAAGLEVHAWINVATMWNLATAPSSPEHVFNQHGPTAEGEDRWLNRQFDGTEFIGNNAFIDPGHPDAVDYIVAAAQSILREYDVDGIHLDFVRYPDFSSTETHSDWGYNEVSVARFQQATGRTDVPAPADPQWSDWRRDQVTNLVRKLYLGIWEVDPAARLSMAGITFGFGPQTMGSWEQTRTYAEVLQDWRGWLADGFMDTVVAMNYKRNWLPPQDQMFTEWTEVIADQQAQRQAVNGTGLFLNPVDDTVEQVVEGLGPTAAGNTAAGWAGFSYANPSDAFVDGPIEDRQAERAALTEALTAGPDAPFADPAAVPSMPWKADPTDGHVAGRLVLRDGTPLDQVPVSLIPVRGGAEQHLLTDGNGWFGFVHVEPGQYLVRAELPDGVAGPPVAPARVAAGQLVEPNFPPLTGVPAG